MATVKKGTMTTAPQWWRHLRPLNKKLVSKAERRAARKLIGRSVEGND